MGTKTSDVFQYVPSLLKPMEKQKSQLGVGKELTERSTRSLSIKSKPLLLNHLSTELSSIKSSKNEVKSEPCSSTDRCPTCQVSIQVFSEQDTFQVHKKNCEIVPNRPLCSQPANCANMNVFHYKIYAHLKSEPSETISPTQPYCKPRYQNFSSDSLSNGLNLFQVESAKIPNVKPESQQLVRFVPKEHSQSSRSPLMNRQANVNFNFQFNPWQKNRIHTDHSSNSSIFEEKPLMSKKLLLRIKQISSPTKSKRNSKIKSATKKLNVDTPSPNDHKRKSFPIVQISTNGEKDTTVRYVENNKSKPNLLGDSDSYCSSATIMQNSRDYRQSLSRRARVQNLKNNLNILSESSDSSLDSCHFSDFCASEKLIEGTPFAVDAFEYGSIKGVRVYFLTQFNDRCYKGLTRNFPHQIYCSSITAQLLQSILNIPAHKIEILEINTTRYINKIEIQIFDANCCAGSLLLFFRAPNGINSIYTGFFRATPEMESLPCLWNHKIENLYLDTTFCSPEYMFPTDFDCLDMIHAEITKQFNLYKNLLIVCGIKSLGYEQVWLHIYKHKYVSHVRIASKYKAIIDCIDNNPYLKDVQFSDSRQAQLHLLPIHQVNLKNLQRYFWKHKNNFKHLLAFNLSVSQWKLQPEPITEMNITIAAVPYSRHSSYSELARFVRFVGAKRIISLVKPQISKHECDSILKNIVVGQS